MSLKNRMNRQFLKACKNGDLERVKTLSTHITPKELGLSLAIKYGRLNIVKYLVENGANIHHDSGEPIRDACRNGHLSVVKYLVEKGVDIHNHQEASMRLACFNGYLKIVKYLVSLGVNCNTGDHFYLASCGGHLDVVKYLVSQGVDHLQDDDRALWNASGNGHLDIVQYLFENGVYTIHTFSECALQSASMNGHLDIVKYLVEVGNCVIREDDDRVLWNASRNGHLPVVKYLVSKGADIKNATMEHQKIIAGLRIWRYWRRRQVREWARRLLPIYFHPDSTGGKRAKKEIGTFVEEIEKLSEPLTRT